MSAPPFATAAAAATYVGELVPDTKAGTSNADFVTAALEALSEDAALVEATDIGDGTTKAWILPGAALAAFDRWDLGFSENYPVDVECLVAAAPIFDPAFLRPEAEYRLERRSGAAGVPTLYIVFANAPTSADKVRVRWRRRYRSSAWATELPPHLHLAVAYKAAERKCAELASVYASTVDLAVNSDVFQADPTSSRYRGQAKDYEARYRKVLGAGGRGTFTAGPIDPRPGKVWNLAP